MLIHGALEESQRVMAIVLNSPNTDTVQATVLTEEISVPCVEAQGFSCKRLRPAEQCAANAHGA